MFLYLKQNLFLIVFSSSFYKLYNQNQTTDTNLYTNQSNYNCFYTNQSNYNCFYTNQKTSFNVHNTNQSNYNFFLSERVLLNIVYHESIGHNQTASY